MTDSVKIFPNKLTGDPVCHQILRAQGAALAEAVTLRYEARLIRRKKLRTDRGRAFLLDLAQTTSLNSGDALELSDGTRIAVAAAREPLLAITGDLVRLAWHIGNRHTPCQIEPARLLIQRDKVLKAMLEQLGAGIIEVEEPFTPEGGAYGHGRTMGHDHGPETGHDHGPETGHTHPHPHA